MTRKYMANLVLLLIIILPLMGCENSVKESDVSGKVYIYEKAGFGGDFTITIKDDGTFSYYEGPLSSYIGGGEWALEEDTLCLSSNGRSETPHTYCFQVDGEDLVFNADQSDSFLYVKISDGERFLGSLKETPQQS